MIVVVNGLTLGKPIDATLLSRIESDFLPGMRRLAGFGSFELVSTSETEAVVIVRYQDAGSMREIGSKYASPWFLKHVRPYFAGEGQRIVGELLCAG